MAVSRYSLCPVSYTHLDVYKRQLAGSFGIVLSVPVTVLLAVLLYTRHKKAAAAD